MNDTPSHRGKSDVSHFRWRSGHGSFNPSDPQIRSRTSGGTRGSAANWLSGHDERDR